jgi:hypothetical protein
MNAVRLRTAWTRRHAPIFGFVKLLKSTGCGHAIFIQ